MTKNPPSSPPVRPGAKPPVTSTENVVVKLFERSIDHTFATIGRFTDIPKTVMKQADPVAKYLAMLIAAVGIVTGFTVVLMILNMAIHRNDKIDYVPIILTIFGGGGGAVVLGFPMIIILGRQAPTRELGNGFKRIEENRKRRSKRAPKGKTATEGNL
jgi:hypothetical protein